MTIACDICVIGAGSGGLVVAAAAAQFGQKVVLIEKDKMGGDCLNYGCVPSKALIAAAKHAHALRTGAAFGVAPATPVVDFAKVHDHVHQVIAAIAPVDSQERFEGLGVRVIRTTGRFRDAVTVTAGAETITAHRFVIATGSRPAAPPIPGLNEVDYLTNESVFDLTALPQRLLIIGAGPIGLELAQAFARLGSQVTVVEAAQPLAKEDPELATIVLDRVRAEGVEILSSVKVMQIAKGADGIVMTLEEKGATRSIAGTHLLVAAGRKPNIEDLDLAAAGIASNRAGIVVDAGLKTSNRKVYAIGDVAGGLQFTHVASAQAGLVIRNALFRLPVNTASLAIPWVTFTDPELARIGLTEAEAKAKYGSRVEVIRSPFAHNDRAQADRTTEGLVKAVVGPRGRILGAAIVGAHAGELIHVWALAMAQGLGIKALAGMVAPYPTLGEANRRVAVNYFAGLTTNRLLRGAIGLLRRLG